MPQHVGFIGVGRMGRPMASRLLDAGYALTVSDLHLESVAALTGRGAATAGSPAEVASAVEVLFLSLPDPAIVRDVALGTNGVIEGSRVRTVVDLSTTGTTMTQEIAAALASKSITLVGLDPRVMVDVINAGSGRNSASQDKFPQAILPRTFDSGFSTGLMYKDLRLCLAQADALGVPMSVANAVRDLWRRAFDEIGPDEDFTTIVQLVERGAGVEVKG